MRVGFRRLGLLAALFAGICLAAPAQASCLPPGTEASRTAEFANTFQQRPQSLLDNHPRAGGAMTRDVRQLVSYNPQLSTLIGGLVPTATAQQKQAIATGLGQAALLCALSDPAGAQAIQAAVVGIGDDTVAALFRSVTGGQETAATAGTGNAGGGQGGSAPGITGSFSGVPGFSGGTGLTNNSSTTPISGSGTSAGALRNSVSP